MESKKFKLTLQLGKKTVFTLDSKTGDNISVDEKQIKLQTKDPNRGMLDTKRFDGATVDEKSFKVSSYTYNRTNEGNAVYCFNIVNG